MGLGEIGEDACRNLVNTKIKNVVISNRSSEKADIVAAECGFRTISFEKVGEAIVDSDIIICSIAQDQPFITKKLLQKREILSHKFLIDLSVPRSVDPAAEEIPGVLLYNIDMIESKATAALNKRMAAIPAVERIIAESISEFSDWAKEMEVSPTINKLKDALEKIRKDELRNHLKGMESDEFEKLDLVTRNLMQKVIKLPVLHLKAACKRGEAETLIDVLNDLFNLEKQPEKRVK